MSIHLSISSTVRQVQGGRRSLFKLFEQAKGRAHLGQVWQTFAPTANWNHPSWFEPQMHSVGSSSPALFACLLLPELVFSSQCLLSPLGTSWCTLKVSFLSCLVLLLFPSFSTDEKDRRVELMRAGHMYVVLSSPLSVSVGLIPLISALWSSWYIFCCVFVSFWTVCNLLYCLIHIDLASLFQPAYVFCVWFISSA